MENKQKQKSKSQRKKLIAAGIGFLLLLLNSSCQNAQIDMRQQEVTQTQVQVAAYAVKVQPSTAQMPPPTVESEESFTGTADFSQYFTEAEIKPGDEVYNRIIGRSYRENEQIDLADLRYLTLPYYNYYHEIQMGEMIVNKAISTDVLEIFQSLFKAEYEIESMCLVDDYWPEDGEKNGIAEGVLADAESMKQNNTSAFNYRLVPGAKSLSKHALGYAIDINPLQNPYVIYGKGGNEVLQSEGDVSYINRENIRPHMINRDDLAFQVFTDYGFEWGGNWNSSKDYQHFVKVP